MRRGMVVFKISWEAVSIILLAISLVLNGGCGKGPVVAKGDKVKVHYKGTLADGTVFDSSQTAQPLEFIVGSGQLIRGFDLAVEGMKMNEEKKVTIKAEDAYGNKDQNLVRSYPRSSVPPNFNPQLNMIVNMQDQNGRQIQAKIVGLTQDTITIDLNHPLAEKDLTFEIKIMGIEKPGSANTGGSGSAGDAGPAGTTGSAGTPGSTGK